MNLKKNSLGRGLGALIEDNVSETRTVVGSVNEIEIRNIEANPYQPRTTFDQEALQELSESIKNMGIIQPITVRMVQEGQYQLISGERRLRAAKLAGMDRIPAYVRSANDLGMMEMALVENIQRENLDAIEIALSYQRLIEEHQLTQESLSEKVGKKRSTVTNYLRLLKLPAKIQIGIRDHKISMGHARAIINIEDPETQIMIYEQIIKYDFSVRKVEEIVRTLSSDDGENAIKEPVSEKIKGNYEDQKIDLKNIFKSKVDIKSNEKGRGKITISFKSNDDLQRIISLFDSLKN